MSDLIGVVVGGVIAICGGAVVPLITHTLKAKYEARERDAARFAELVAAIYEYQYWLEEKTYKEIYGKEKPDTMAPYPKLLSIGMIYFPQFLVQIAQLNAEAKKYEALIMTKALDRFHGEIDKLNDGIDEAHGSYSNAQERLFDAMFDYADKRFKS